MDDLRRSHTHAKDMKQMCVQWQQLFLCSALAAFSFSPAALPALVYQLTPEKDTSARTHNSALQYSDLGNSAAEVQRERRPSSPLGRRGIYGKSLKPRHFLDNCVVSQVFFFSFLRGGFVELGSFLSCLRFPVLF